MSHGEAIKIFMVPIDSIEWVGSCVIGKVGMGPPLNGETN